MKTNMDTPTPQIIAVDFYDGAIEGFASSVQKYDSSFYFKLLAWDDIQDQRLYVLSKINKAEFVSLINLLSQTQMISDTQVWVPEWKFINDMDARKADEIINVSRTNASSNGVFILGRQIDDDSSKIVTIDPVFGNEIKDSINKDCPDNLDVWHGRIQH